MGSIRSRLDQAVDAHAIELLGTQHEMAAVALERDAARSNLEESRARLEAKALEMSGLVITHEQKVQAMEDANIETAIQRNGVRGLLSTTSPINLNICSVVIQAMDV